LDASRDSLRLGAISWSAEAPFQGVWGMLFVTKLLVGIGFHDGIGDEVFTAC
jgi:hypothetical protein